MINEEHCLLSISNVDHVIFGGDLSTGFSQNSMFVTSLSHFCASNDLVIYMWQDRTRVDMNEC